MSEQAQKPARWAVWQKRQVTKLLKQRASAMHELSDTQILLSANLMPDRMADYLADWKIDKNGEPAKAPTGESKTPAATKADLPPRTRRRDDAQRQA